MLNGTFGTIRLIRPRSLSPICSRETGRTLLPLRTPTEKGINLSSHLLNLRNMVTKDSKPESRRLTRKREKAQLLTSTREKRRNTGAKEPVQRPPRPSAGGRTQPVVRQVVVPKAAVGSKRQATVPKDASMSKPLAPAARGKVTMAKKKKAVVGSKAKVRLVARCGYCNQRRWTSSEN